MQNAQILVSSGACDPYSLPPHPVPAPSACGLPVQRPAMMAMYLRMKAKYRYALQQQAQLLEELRATTAELVTETEEKENVLDCLLEHQFGDRARQLVRIVVP
ncbi:hypothetical protein DFH06DRAFT_1484598 [Mycena polygramma]|nr:hypothetical protein DFH06DRAFT_1258652 [Mycena polygramma]KAJ7613784.1 hypothetical protein DFH06DRAFT_1484598 [Mycena polygramma]